MWERGLKHNKIVIVHTFILSLPMWERGLKLVIMLFIYVYGWSLPMWERGLKLNFGHSVLGDLKSLPMWERGLKPRQLFDDNGVMLVAPHVGAWIETVCCSCISLPMLVAPHVGAWIETAKKKDGKITLSRSPCGSVD